MDKQDQERKQSPAPQKQEKEDEDQPRPKRQIDHDDPVEEASDESFPASDPPSSY
ncbi:MAG TPA: hypothetical protein VE078_17830 [Thermoanaerobaculia bacterium]|nr:hypothetical protein [Thermoanaerobaculia bacterium]